MENLIIITGEQGSGKTDYAFKNYQFKAIIFDDATHKDYNKVIESLFENDTTVVVCDTRNVHIFKPKSKNLNYKVITIKDFEVVKTYGRFNR